MSQQSATRIGATLGVAILAFACGAPGPEGGSPGRSVPGAADGWGDGAAAVASCNDGALVVEASTEREGEYVATITDQDVVAFFVEQSQLVSTEAVGYSGESGEVSVEHSFPWMVSVEEREEGSALVIRDLRATDRGYASSGPGGVVIEEEGAGLRVTINGSAMPFSHAVVHYEVGQWLFEDCGAGETEAGASQRTCNDGAFTVVPSVEREGEYVGTITDPGVVAFFVEQSQLFSTEVIGYSGEYREVSVEHAFPWMVTVEAREDGDVLVIRDLRATDRGYASSGPGGVVIEEEGAGLRVTINGSAMPFSHAVVHYEVGQWLFEDCGPTT